MLWTRSLRLVCSVALAGALTASTATPPHPTVEYVRTIPSVREFTKPRSVFTKLVQFVAGPAADKPEILRPYSTTHDSTGRLLIADPGIRGVHIFDFEKHKYLFLKGPRGNAFGSPIDVVCDSADNIYVSDSMRARIYVFDSKGKFVRFIGGGNQEPRFLRPTGMAMDQRAKRIYITDTLRHQVLIVGQDGSLIRVIGKRGKGDGEFNFPTSVALASIGLRHRPRSQNQ